MAVGAPLVRFDVNLTGSSEVSVNGLPMNNSKAGMYIDEKIMLNKLHPEQLWLIYCELQKATRRINDVYIKSRVKAGELTEVDAQKLMDGIRSGSEGVTGTRLGSINPKFQI